MSLHRSLCCGAPGFLLVITAVGCALRCPDGTTIYDGADPSAVEDRYGPPDLVVWRGRGSESYSVPGVPPADLRCGNEPGTLSYVYLDRAEVFRFDQRSRVFAVDQIDERQRAALRARAAGIRQADQER